MTQNDASERRRPFRLSVLDQTPVAEGMSGAQALRNTVDLARLADALGYHRYWLAEHHGSAGLAGTSPELLIGAVAGATRRLRVGSGGVMLPHYSPFKVAELFSTLSGLYPGRIDLGVGRAAGTDPRTTLALQRDRRQGAPDDFPQQLGELLDYFAGTGSNKVFARLAGLLPGRPETPEPWLLGSSPQSGLWAAELGLPYAFADFINAHGASVARHYRETFMPGERGDRPRVTVCVWAVCAETDAEAERLASSGRMMIAMLHRGQSIAVPSVETALAFLADDDASAGGLPQLRAERRRVVGAPATVRAGLEAVAAEYDADEVMVVTITHDHAARRRSYELIAAEFGLADGAATADADAAVPA